MSPKSKENLTLASIFALGFAAILLIINSQKISYFLASKFTPDQTVCGFVSILFIFTLALVARKVYLIVKLEKKASKYRNESIKVNDDVYFTVMSGSRINSRIVEVDNDKVKVEVILNKKDVYPN